MLFPHQAPKHFHPTLFDDVRGFTDFVFPKDDLTRCEFTNPHTATLAAGEIPFDPVGTVILTTWRP